jgi:hypothetical protein
MRYVLTYLAGFYGFLFIVNFLVSNVWLSLILPFLAVFLIFTLAFKLDTVDDLTQDRDKVTLDEIMKLKKEVQELKERKLL